MRAHPYLLKTACAAALLAASATWAMTAPAMSVRSGGSTVEEFQLLNASASDYSLKLVLASKGSGAYVADIDITVRSLPSRNIVLEQMASGPLVLMALPPGRYEVSATSHDVLPGAPATLKRVLNVPRSGLANLVLYFDSGDAVEPDSPAVYSTR